MESSLLWLFFFLKYQFSFFLSFFLLTIITRDKTWQKAFSLKAEEPCPGPLDLFHKLAVGWLFHFQ